jgi:hypothetical protein
MGGTTNTTTNTSTSAPTNPDVQATASKLAQKLSGLADRSPAAYGQSLYPGVSGATRNAWALGTNAANNLIGSGGLTSGQQGAVNGLQGLVGAYGQDSPGYQAMRQTALDDAIKNVGAGFNAAGRYGGGSYINDATNAAVNAIAPLDYQNYQNGIENQKGIYSALFNYGQQGLANQQSALASLGAIGGAQDADLLAQRQGEADLYTRQQQAPLQWLQGLTSAAAGNAAGTGTTMTNTQTSPGTPWWQTAASLGLGAAGLFL